MNLSRATPTYLRDPPRHRLCSDPEIHPQTSIARHGHQSVEREAADFTPQQVRHARLSDFQALGCLSLREPFLLDSTNLRSAVISCARICRFRASADEKPKSENTFPLPLCSLHVSAIPSLHGNAAVPARYLRPASFASSSESNVKRRSLPQNGPHRKPDTLSPREPESPLLPALHPASAGNPSAYRHPEPLQLITDIRPSFSGKPADTIQRVTHPVEWRQFAQRLIISKLIYRRQLD